MSASFADRNPDWNYARAIPGEDMRSDRAVSRITSPSGIALDAHALYLLLNSMVEGKIPERFSYASYIDLGKSDKIAELWREETGVREIYCRPFLWQGSGTREWGFKTTNPDEATVLLRLDMAIGD